MPITLTQIRRYPIKSCRGETLPSATVEPWGLEGDRRWMLVDQAGGALTAREHPRLLLTTPQLREGGIRVSDPELGELDVATPDDGSALVEVDVWGNVVSAAPAGELARAWFSRLLGVPARLVYLDDPTRRRPTPAYSTQADRVSFADGFPLLLTTEDSLAALNEAIRLGPSAAEGPVPIVRFRPSVVVHGAAPWAEDGWRRIRIGAAEFRVVKGCDRCVLTTIDPQTTARGREPLATLARHRKWDGKVWFGVNLVPDNPGTSIEVGDEVDILEQVESDGPPR